MGILRRLFGKSSDDTQLFTDAFLLEGLDEEGGEQVAIAGLDVSSSPKKVCRYIFQQMKAGRSASQLQEELQGRGFEPKFADMCIQFIRASMFKGR